jgi:hypothetical protein
MFVARDTDQERKEGQNDHWFHDDKHCSLLGKMGACRWPTGKAKTNRDQRLYIGQKINALEGQLSAK